MKYIQPLLLALILMAPAGIARADYIPYDVSSGVTGNLGFNLTVGMDFQVNSNITVTNLGTYDSAQDGLTAPIVVSIYELTSNTTGTLVTQASVPAGTGATLIHGSRFVPISPVGLLAGHTYSIVAGAYTANDPFNNQVDSNPGYMTLNNPNGDLTFVGSGRYTFVPGAFPSTIDNRSAAPYAAGTFIVQSTTVPEPTSASLLLLGSIGLFVSVRRARKAS